MRVHDRLHVRARAVDAAMQVPLQRRVAFAFELIRLQVDDAKIVYGEQAALAGPDVDEEAPFVQPDAAVAVVVDDVGLLEHPDAVDQLLLGVWM
jgi:hypothetical protein